MYTDAQETIRNSLWNFMGNLLTASAFTETKAKESVTALMSEELCKFCKNEDETTVDMVASKPLLKSAVWILEARLNEVKAERSKLDEGTPAYEYLTKGIEDMSNLIASLNSFISNL